MYNELKGHAYGGMFQFRKPVVFIRDPDLIKTVTIKDFDYFTDHYFVVTEEADSMWGKGIFNLREAGILVVELKDLFTRYANDVIATSAFGVGVDSFSKPSNEFYLMGKEATSFNGIRVLVWMANAMLDIPVITKRIKKYFTLLIKDAMATRAEKGIIRPDLVQLLMEAKKENLQEENNPNHKKKEKMSKLQDEIDAAMRENGGKISYETLHSMKYLDMVISGSRFALMESKIVLVKLLNRFDFKVVPRTPIPAKISKTAMNTSIEDNWIGLEIRNNRLNPH
ncbi:Cytochrome P450 9e2 [Blattella germanica]|nr:Cytochrome P450 9e2 [Blattella germanica]